MQPLRLPPTPTLALALALALVALLGPVGCDASGAPALPTAIAFVSEPEFEAECARHSLRTASFAFDAELLQRSDEFASQDTAHFSQGAFLGSALNLRPERTALPVGLQLRRTVYNAYVGFVYRESQQAGAAPGAGAIQLNSDPTDDDVTISFYTRVRGGWLRLSNEKRRNGLLLWFEKWREGRLRPTFTALHV